jgi:hypothetical protein
MSRKGARGPSDGATEAEIKRYWQRREAHEREAKKVWKLRKEIIQELGGPTCRVCQEYLGFRRAEIHHMEGRSWPMSWNPRRRTLKFKEELESGVWLTILCKECNSSIGDPNA